MRTVGQWLFAALFVGAGISHFRFPAVYARIVPPFLPWPGWLVLISGICEVALGLLLLVPATTRLAAWGLIALLLAVFPANIYMAVQPDLFPRVPHWLLWARLPVQALLIAWAWAYSYPSR